MAKASMVMVGIAVLEGAPLASAGLSPGGPAYLGRLLGWHTASIAPLAWLMAAAVTLGYAALSMRSLPFIRRHVFDLTPLKLLAVLFALITGTFEEWFFRQWIMDALQTRGFSLVLQVATSAIVFGLAHAIWGLFGRNLRAAILAMVYTGGLGLALALVYIVSGRQLAPAAWSHIAINLIIEPWLMLGVMNLPRPGRGTAPAT